MLPILALSIVIALAILPETSGTITCKAACLKCKQELDVMKLVEVYCAMCRECQLRRTQKRRNMAEGGAVQSMEAGVNEQNVNEAEPRDTLEHDDENIVTPSNDKPAVIAQSAPSAQEMDLEDGSVMPSFPTSHPTNKYDPHIQPQYNIAHNKNVWKPQPPGLYNNPGINNSPYDVHKLLDYLSYQPQKAHRQYEQYYTVNYNDLEIPEGCPLPPYCDEVESEEIINKLKSTQETTIFIPTTTTTTTTSTTTRRPCPDVKCRVRKKHKIIENDFMIKIERLIEILMKNKQTNGMPVCPMTCPVFAAPMACPLPPGCNPISSSSTTTPQSSSPATTASHKAFLRNDSNSDFMYLYVGIPKDGVQS